MISLFLAINIYQTTLFGFKNAKPDFSNFQRKKDDSSSQRNNFAQFSFKNIIHTPEKIAFFIFILYAITYVIGKIINSKKIKSINSIFNQFFSKYFAAGNTFKMQAVNEYVSYFTGRSGYTGCLVHISFAPICDPLGFLYTLVAGQKSKLSFEFVLNPPHWFNATFCLIPEFSSPKDSSYSKLKAKNCQEKILTFDNANAYSYVSAMHNSDIFINKIKSFLSKRPNSISMIELSSDNNFETRSNSNYVAKLDFYFPPFMYDNLESIFDASFFEFVMSLVDDFVCIGLNSK